MARIAITGGSGFLGSSIYREMNRVNELNGKELDNIFLFDRSEPVNFSNLPKNVQWIKCDISNKESVSDAMAMAKSLDQLWLVAGVLGTSELNEVPSKASINNIVGLCNFMDILVEYKKKGKKFPRVFYPTKPNVWDNMYTITKECSEKVIQYYMKEFGLTGVIHKWYNAYGPGQHTHPIRKAVPYFILMALNNKPLKIHGKGNQTIDLVHVDDISRIAVEAMNKPEEELTNREVIDIGTGVEMTVNKLAKSIVKLCNSSSEIIHETMRSGEVPDTKLAANTLRQNQIINKTLGFKDYEKGMKETIEYYRNLDPKIVQSALKFYSKTA